MICNEVKLSLHAAQRMTQRSVSWDDLLQVVEHGVIVEDYPDDLPLPSRLLLGSVHGRPLHVVVAAEPDGSLCVIVTVYQPDNVVWLDDFIQRRKP